MTKDRVVQIVVESNRFLREKYRSYHSSYLIDEIIRRVEEEKGE